MSSIFLYSTAGKHLKNYENGFLFYLKRPFCSRDIQFFVFFPSLSVSRFKRSGKTAIFMKPWIGFHKLANAVFGITQKPFCIKSSKLPRWSTTEKGIFLNMFLHPERPITSSRLLLLSIILPIKRDWVQRKKSN